MPQRIWAASNAGPAGAAVASVFAEEPSTISEFVPTSMNRRTRRSSVMPVARMPATMSGPTYAPSAGNMTAGARGCTRTPKSAAVACGMRRATTVNGAIERGSGSMPSAIWIIVMLPATTISYTSAGSTPASAHTSSVSCWSVSCACVCSRSSAPSSIMIAEIREMTSAPNGCCALRTERTAFGRPVSRSSSVATTVVVPRSKAMAWRLPLVSPSSTSMSTSSATTAVTFQSARRSVPPSSRTMSRGTRSSRSSIAASSRSRSDFWSSSVASSSFT